MVFLAFFLTIFNCYSYEITKNETSILLKGKELKDSEISFLIVSENSKMNSLVKGDDIPKVMITDTIYELANLATESKYQLFIKKGKKTDTILTNTLALEPKKNTVRFKTFNPEEGKIKLSWFGGNGKRNLLLIRKDFPPILPQDGIKYNTSFYGDLKNKLDSNTYAIAILDTIPKEFVIDSLDYGKYYVGVFDFNGDNQFINYNTTTVKTNPKALFTKIIPPKNIKQELTEENIYKITWDKIEGSVYYELQVSKDEGFLDLLENYNNADIGNGSEFEIQVDDLNINCYYRLRTIGEDNKSEYSVINVLGTEK